MKWFFIVSWIIVSAGCSVSLYRNIWGYSMFLMLLWMALTLFNVAMYWPVKEDIE